MDEPTVTVDVHRLTRHVTMQVRFVGQRRMAIRYWIAKQLIRLAALVIGCNVKIDASITPRPANGGGGE